MADQIISKWLSTGLCPEKNTSAKLDTRTLILRTCPFSANIRSKVGLLLALLFAWSGSAAPVGVSDPDEIDHLAMI